ncbi:MAG: DUF4239 domain-containing protein [Nitrospinae bacterium]|nr:DUF4239 domain-containing protein [Nitrospinota bacterium]MBF0633860.1 DUF4239 domain-containing protein [Nitrospinota bacterium]
MSFSVWLVMIPQWLCLMLVMLFFVGFGVGVVMLVRQFVHHTILKQHNDIAGFVFATVGVIYGVMLAFVVIVIWEQFNDANSIARSEATQAYSLYRDLLNYPDQELIKQPLASLAAFSKAVLELEYPAMRNMKWESEHVASAETEKKFLKLWKDIKAISPKTMQEDALFHEILADINSLGREREKRLIIARDDLPGVIWTAMILGALVTIGFTALFGNENLKGQIVITGLLSIVVSLVIFVVITLNFPFVGEVSIAAEGYEYLIDQAGWNKKPGI